MKKRFKKAVVSSLVAVFVLSLIAGLTPLDLVQPVSAASTKKAPIRINNTGGGVLSYYQVNLNITYDSDMNNDFSDLRVKNETAGAFVPYWIEDKSDGAWCNLWFNATSIPASGWCNDTYYLYYGDAGASSASNGINTFEFFDDFEQLIEEWCWFTDPRAIYFEGTYRRTYVTWVGEKGIWIKYYDHDSKKWSDANKIYTLTQDDDHCNPSILILSSGHVLIFWSGHCLGPVYMKKSTSPEDISAWESEIVISGSDDECTYSYPLLLENGSIWAAYRSQTVSWSDRRYVISSDNGSTWSAPITLVDFPETPQQAAYIKMETQGNEVHVAASYSQAAGDKKNIYYAYYDGVVWMRRDGTEISLPLTQSNMDLVYDSGASNSWIWDIAVDDDKNPYMVFADKLETANIEYKWSYWNGSAWETHKIADSNHGHIGHANYAGGVYLNHKVPTQVYASVYISGFFEIQKFETINNGGTWSKIYNITSNSTANNIRPCAVRNYNPELEVFWMGGEFVTYNKYRTSLQSYPTPTGSPIPELWDALSGNFSKVTSEKYQGEKSLKLYGASAIVVAHRPSISNAVFSAVVYSEGSAGDYGGLLGRASKTEETFYHVRPNFSDHSEIRKQIDGVWTGGILGDGSPCDYNIWKRWELRCFEGNLKFYYNNIYLCGANDSDIAIGTIGARCYESSSPIYLDNIFIRKYALSEPIASLGNEQNFPVPSISNLGATNIKATTATITWSVNQSSNNRVFYGKNANLMDGVWSVWTNNTNSPSIGLSDLSGETLYYYQAWSYNSINLSDSEPVSEPYGSFITTHATKQKFTDMTKTSIALMGILAIVALAVLIIGVLLNIQSGAEIDLKTIMIGAVGLIAFMIVMFVGINIFSAFT